MQIPNSTNHKQIGEQKKDRQWQADQQRQHNDDVAATPDRFERLEGDEFVDCVADVAQREPDQVERGKAEEQCEFESLPGRDRRPACHHGEADKRAGEHDQCVEGDDGARLGGNRIVAAPRQMPRALPDKQNLCGAEIEQPERYAKGSDQDVDGKLLRRQHARKYESLDEPADDSGCRGRCAQQEIANGQQTCEQPHRAPQGVLAPGCRGSRGHGRRS